MTLTQRFAHSLASQHLHMGKQYNKTIKKKRRIAYLKRKKAAAKVTTKKSAKK